MIDGAGAPLIPSQVADRVLIPSATVTATLDLLERRGWIRRAPNPDDRRSTLVEITPDGCAVADQILPGIRMLEKSILSALTPDERVQLLDLLAEILDRAVAVATRRPRTLTGLSVRPAASKPAAQEVAEVITELAGSGPFPRSTVRPGPPG